MAKKCWWVEVAPDVNTEIAKKIKRLVKPELSVVRSRPEPCFFCGYVTSWTINNRTVCPSCSGKYGFINPAYHPGPCEICGEQGEWYCGKKDQHDLCWRHRDAWFEWTREPYLPRGSKDLSKEEQDIAWEKAFTDFIEAMKKKQGLI